MIIINSPHNPTGSLLEADDLDSLAELTRDTDIVILSDEVYEHIVFDGAQHQSVAAHPELAGAQHRRLVVRQDLSHHRLEDRLRAWPRDELMAEFRKVHQFNVFTVNTPCQFGIAEYMGDASRHLGLAAFYEGKREFFREQLRASRFELLPAAAPIFNWRATAPSLTLPDREFACWLTREAGWR
jgi:methionine aminotransferase